MSVLNSFSIMPGVKLAVERGMLSWKNKLINKFAQA